MSNGIVNHGLSIQPHEGSSMLVPFATLQGIPVAMSQAHATYQGQPRQLVAMQPMMQQQQQQPMMSQPYYTVQGSHVGSVPSAYSHHVGQMHHTTYQNSQHQFLMPYTQMVSATTATQQPGMVPQVQHGLPMSEQQQPALVPASSNYLEQPLVHVLPAEKQKAPSARKAGAAAEPESEPAPSGRSQGTTSQATTAPADSSGCEGHPDLNVAGIRSRVSRILSSQPEWPSEIAADVTCEVVRWLSDGRRDRKVEPLITAVLVEVTRRFKLKLTWKEACEVVNHAGGNVTVGQARCAHKSISGSAGGRVSAASSGSADGMVAAMQQHVLHPFSSPRDLPATPSFVSASSKVLLAAGALGAAATVAGGGSLGSAAGGSGLHRVGSVHQLLQTASSTPTPAATPNSHASGGIAAAAGGGNGKAHKAGCSDAANGGNGQGAAKRKAPVTGKLGAAGSKAGGSGATMAGGGGGSAVAAAKATKQITAAASISEETLQRILEELWGLASSMGVQPSDTQSMMNSAYPHALVLSTRGHKTVAAAVMAFYNEPLQLGMSAKAIAEAAGLHASTLWKVKAVLDKAHAASQKQQKQQAATAATAAVRVGAANTAGAAAVRSKQPLAKRRRAAPHVATAVAATGAAASGRPSPPLPPDCSAASGGDQTSAGSTITAAVALSPVEVSARLQPQSHGALLGGCHGAGPTPTCLMPTAAAPAQGMAAGTSLDDFLSGLDDDPWAEAGGGEGHHHHHASEHLNHHHQNHHASEHLDHLHHACEDLAAFGGGGGNSAVFGGGGGGGIASCWGDDGDALSLFDDDDALLLLPPC